MKFPLLDRDSAHHLASALAASCSLAPEARGRHDADTIALLAHALPKRAAVWWGALCCWAASRPAPAGPEDMALRAAVRWAIDPSGSNRLAALAPGESAGMRTPAGCLALAASWSAGSLAPAGLPTVAAPDDTTGRLVAGAVMLAAVGGDASGFRHRFREFLAIGAEVASGRNLWAEGDPLASSSPSRCGMIAPPFDAFPNPIDPIASAL